MSRLPHSGRLSIHSTNPSVFNSYPQRSILWCGLSHSRKETPFYIATTRTKPICVRNSRQELDLVSIKRLCISHWIVHDVVVVAAAVVVVVFGCQSFSSMNFLRPTITGENQTCYLCTTLVCTS